VYCSNPPLSPRPESLLQGLRREIYSRWFWSSSQTDTADIADLLLPVTTFLEHTDLYLAYGHYYVQLARAALPAPESAAPTSTSSAN